MTLVVASAHSVGVPLAVPLAKGGEAVKAGPVGLVVIVLLCVASYFLFRSMSKHLRTVRENFPSDAPPGATHTPPGPTHTPPADAPTPSGSAPARDVPAAYDAPTETPPTGA